MPKVTVLMAVYNGERYLREAIESILGQTFQDFEFLIVNDGSTDSTRDIILSYDDPRIRLVDNAHNLGLARSLNRGLKLAEGQFVARQDADDISEPKRLARQVAFLERQTDVALLGTWYKEIDAQGNLIGKARLPCDNTDIRWSFLFFCPFVHSAIMLRKPVILGRIGFYNEALAYAMDYELWHRIARCLPVANLNDYLVRFQTHPQSMTATYGDRTQEGVRIRIAAVGHLLGWDKTEVAMNEARFDLFFSLLYGSPPALDLNEVNGLIDEILQLHAAFCQSYEISRRDCRIRRMRLRSRLSQKILQMAYCRLAQGDYQAARQFLARARRLHWPTLFSPKSVRSCARLVVGPGLVRAIKHCVALHKPSMPD